jgi:hypothetical protein
MANRNRQTVRILHYCSGEEIGSIYNLLFPENTLARLADIMLLVTKLS